MEVLTIESKSFNILIEKIDLMAKLLVSEGKTKDREQLLDTYELCQYLKISPSTAQRMRKNYKISFIKSGRKIYYYKVDIEAFLNRRRCEAE